MTPQQWQKLKRWICLGVFAGVFLLFSGIVLYRIVLAIVVAGLEIR